jgi:hypothetical protein
MIDLNDLSNLNGAGADGFVRLVNDGDTVTFFIPASSELRERRTVWDGATARDAKPDETDGVRIRHIAEVAVVDGGKVLTKVLEQGPKTWSKIGEAAKKAGGALQDHVFSLERIGDKGDKQTNYRVRVVGKAADYVKATEDKRETVVDYKATLMGAFKAKGLDAATINAIMVAQGAKSLMAATDEQCQAVLAQVSSK